MNNYKWAEERNKQLEQENKVMTVVWSRKKNEGLQKKKQLEEKFKALEQKYKLLEENQKMVEEKERKKRNTKSWRWEMYYELMQMSGGQKHKNTAWEDNQLTFQLQVRFVDWHGFLIFHIKE